MHNLQKKHFPVIFTWFLLILLITVTLGKEILTWIFFGDFCSNFYWSQQRKNWEIVIKNVIFKKNTNWSKLVEVSRNYAVPKYWKFKVIWPFTIRSRFAEGLCTTIASFLFRYKCDKWQNRWKSTRSNNRSHIGAGGSG